MPNHCSLGLLPSLELFEFRGPWNRSAARARLAEVVAELTGCLGRDERSGGEVFGTGATILAERVWPDGVDGIGGWYRLRAFGLLFSLPFEGVVGRVRLGDLAGRLRSAGLDITDGGRE